MVEPWGHIITVNKNCEPWGQIICELMDNFSAFHFPAAYKSLMVNQFVLSRVCLIIPYDESAMN